MQKVTLTTSDLNTLARHHPTLAPYFQATLPYNRLPAPETFMFPCGFIMNTDTSNLPGRHWLGLWLPKKNVCKVLDSFSLDLDVYETTAPLQACLKQFKYVTRNRQSLQSVMDQSCGDYAFMFLVMRSQGKSLTEFVNMFNKHDYVRNDRKVGKWLGKLIKKERQWQCEARVIRQTFVDGKVEDVIEQGTPRSRTGVRHLVH